MIVWKRRNEEYGRGFSGEESRQIRQKVLKGSNIHSISLFSSFVSPFQFALGQRSPELLGCSNRFGVCIFGQCRRIELLDNFLRDQRD